MTMNFLKIFYYMMLYRESQKQTYRDQYHIIPYLTILHSYESAMVVFHLKQTALCNVSALRLTASLRC